MKGIEKGVAHILESTTQAGPKMTAALANYGNGRMGDGILKLMARSEKTGMIKGTLITGAVASVVIFASNLYMWRKIKRVEQNGKRILNTLLNDLDEQQHNPSNTLANAVEEDGIADDEEPREVAEEGRKGRTESVT